MSHHIYKTEGFVLASRERGEADKSLHIFTRDLGAIYVRASGIRKDKSKLRYATQEFSHSSFELIRGKQEWRLTNAQPGATYAPHLVDPRTRDSFGRIIHLLRRLCRGEEANEKLYALLDLVFSEFSRTENVRALELYAIIHILFYLGYWRENASSGEFFEKQWTLELAAMLDTHRAKLILQINESLKASHL